MKLFCFPRSGNSREVKLVLEEKGIPYENLNIREEAVKESEDFKKASPTQKVPAIIDGDVYMNEAYDICEYLEDKYPDTPLLPKDDSERQKIQEWSDKYEKELALKIGLLLIECVLKPKERQSEDVKEKLRRGICEALSECESHLADQEYFFGEYSLADISLTPHINIIGRLGLSLDDFPHVHSWMERVRSRPNFAATQE